jgi:hypothetical protein
MITKHDKKGPELMVVDTAMLQGVENLCNIAKKNRDNDLYEYLSSVKTALSKYPAIAETINERAKEAREISKKLHEWADLAEQIFPIKIK